MLLEMKLTSGTLKMMNNEGYYSGTSGLLLPVPNKQYYPEEFKTKSRLCYYSSLFNSIEINSSFYKVPQKNTVARWVVDTPSDFKFTFKLWRGITHNKGLVFKQKEVFEFMDRISVVEQKKGCLLVQFPGSIKTIHTSELLHLLFSIRSADPDKTWKVAVEFRDMSWYRSETYEILSHFQMGLVLHDKLVSGGQLTETDLDYVYVRFHGPGGDYRGSYDDNFLYEYASYVKEWMLEGKSVYTYFNNTMGAAIANLTTLRSYILD